MAGFPDDSPSEMLHRQAVRQALFVVGMIVLIFVGYMAGGPVGHERLGLWISLGIVGIVLMLRK